MLSPALIYRATTSKVHQPVDLWINHQNSASPHTSLAWKATVMSYVGLRNSIQRSENPKVRKQARASAKYSGTSRGLVGLAHFHVKSLMQRCTLLLFRYSTSHCVRRFKDFCCFILSVNCQISINWWSSSLSAVMKCSSLSVAVSYEILNLTVIFTAVDSLNLALASVFLKREINKSNFPQMRTFSIYAILPAPLPSLSFLRVTPCPRMTSKFCQFPSSYSHGKYRTLVTLPVTEAPQIQPHFR